MKSERQNTISQALVIDSARTRTPPDDQQMAATIMNAMARRWRAAGVTAEAGFPRSLSGYNENAGRSRRSGRG